MCVVMNVIVRDSSTFTTGGHVFHSSSHPSEDTHTHTFGDYTAVHNIKTWTNNNMF